MVKYLSFHNSFFNLKILFNVNGKATVVTGPLFHDIIIIKSDGSKPEPSEEDVKSHPRYI